MSEPEFQLPGYVIQRRLGDGGMATVYLAIQRSLDRSVAIKVMRSSKQGEDNEERRFMLEARTLARLPHPNIVAVYDIAQNEQFNYIVMEYLRGGVLSERMKSGLPMHEAIGIIVQIADALQFAHDNGVIHRDLKPANVLFRGPSTPVLTDFGIARLQDTEATRLTRPGMVIGTPSYMSPEQALGAPVDGRSDQYSLGIVLYEMLARKLPFAGDTTMALAYHHVNTKPPALPLRFEFAQPLIDKLLAKNPKDRFPDLKSFARELRHIVTDNQNLQQVLQLAPGQSDSEKLRALGFSDNQIHSGGTRAAPAILPSLEAAKEGNVPSEVVAYRILEGSSLKLEAVGGPDVLRPVGEPAPVKHNSEPYQHAKPQHVPRMGERSSLDKERDKEKARRAQKERIKNIAVGIGFLIALLLAVRYYL